VRFDHPPWFDQLPTAVDDSRSFEADSEPAAWPSGLELEPSTRCSLFCPSCPRAIFKDTWLNQDMRPSTFEAILPIFSHVRRVDFRGWGDPLLNPDFTWMARRAANTGVELTLTTNGQIKPDRSLLPLFKQVNFRIDYGRAVTYERRNPRQRFNRMLLNVSRTIKASRDLGADAPEINLLFVKNVYSFKELSCYLDMAGRLGPDRVVLYQPFFHFRQVDAQGELPGEIDWGLIDKVEKDLVRRAEAYGLDLIESHRPGTKADAKRCRFGPGRMLFVDWRGYVSVCRHKALPVAGGRFQRWNHDGVRDFSTAYLGSLVERPLSYLLEKRDFKESLKLCRRTSALQPLHLDCASRPDHPQHQAIPAPDSVAHHSLCPVGRSIDRR
jgi:MoaA/NifB/PqqE/SkfB family radical SAM enzyme